MKTLNILLILLIFPLTVFSQDDTANFKKWYLSAEYSPYFFPASSDPSNGDPTKPYTAHGFGGLIGRNITKKFSLQMRCYYRFKDVTEDHSSSYYGSFNYGYYKYSKVAVLDFPLVMKYRLLKNKRISPYILGGMGFALQLYNNTKWEYIQNYEPNNPKFKQIIEESKGTTLGGAIILAVGIDCKVNDRFSVNIEVMPLFYWLVLGISGGITFKF